MVNTLLLDNIDDGTLWKTNTLAHGNIYMDNALANKYIFYAVRDLSERLLLANMDNALTKIYFLGCNELSERRTLHLMGTFTWTMPNVPTVEPIFSCNIISELSFLNKC